MALLINVKMLTIVCIFIFISKEKLMLSLEEHEKNVLQPRVQIFPCFKL